MLLIYPVFLLLILVTVCFKLHQGVQEIGTDRRYTLIYESTMPGWTTMAHLTKIKPSTVKSNFVRIFVSNVFFHDIAQMRRALTITRTLPQVQPGNCKCIKCFQDAVALTFLRSLNTFRLTFLRMRNKCKIINVQRNDNRCSV